MNYQMIKNNYDRGLWSKVAVRIAVTKGIITREQYQEITGEPYPA